MPGIARGLVDSAGGGPLIQSQSFFRVDGYDVVRLGDHVTSHGFPPHDAAVMAFSSLFFKVSGIPVCRAGDAASCGHPAAPGSLWFRVNA